MFYVRANSALSLRALKKHLTSFKRLSRVPSSNDYRCSFELGREEGGTPELSRIRKLAFLLPFSLDTFLSSFSFFFLFFLMTGTY